MGGCRHSKNKRTCKKCRQICEHKVNKRYCIKCKRAGTGGNDICEHDNNRFICKKCKEIGAGGEQLCKHNKIKYICRTCSFINAVRIADIETDSENDINFMPPRTESRKRRCQTRGKNAKRLRLNDPCDHENYKYFCVKCKELGIGGAGLCKHNKDKTYCIICRPVTSKICEHEKSRDFCYDCQKNGTGGRYVCQHSNNKYRCKACRLIEEEKIETMDAELNANIKEKNIKIIDVDKESIEDKNIKIIDVDKIIDNKLKDAENKNIKIESGNYICEHFVCRFNCTLCKAAGTGGDHICEHNNIVYKCNICTGVNVEPVYFEKINLVDKIPHDIACICDECVNVIFPYENILDL